MIGFLGIFFLAAWALTDHVVGYHNENVMLCAPWAIAFTGTGIRLLFGGRYRAWLAWGYRALGAVLALYLGSQSTASIGVAAILLFGAASVGLSTSIGWDEKLIRAALGLSVFATIVKVLPWFDQKNGFFILFFVPLWLGAAFGIHMVKKRLDRDANGAVPDRKKLHDLSPSDEDVVNEDEADKSAEALGAKEKAKGAPAKKKKKKKVEAGDAASLPPSENPPIEEG